MSVHGVPRSRCLGLFGCLLSIGLVWHCPAAAERQLTIKVVDGTTGLPGDARIGIYSPDGSPLMTPDPGILTHFSPSIGYYVHVSDSLVVNGEEGAWALWASGGITSIPVYRAFGLDGARTETVTIDHWIDPAADGWFGADTHGHLQHQGGFDYDQVSRDQAASAARGEGLDLMYLLDNDADHPGGPVIPAQPGVKLVWGEEYRNAFWGHTVWLGLDHLVTWYSAGAGCCGELFPAWPTLTWTFEAEPAGLKILAHPRSTNEPAEPFAQWPGSGYGRERAALALGTLLDGFAVASASNADHPWAIEEYLDATRSGARWAAVGEGDRPLDRFEVSPPGSPRTYAWIGPGWSLDTPGIIGAWEDALRERHSYATTGPVVRDFRIGSVPMGGVYDRTSPGPADLSFSVAAFRPLTHVTLHGASGVHWEFLPGPGKVALDTTITLSFEHDDFVVLEVDAASDGWRELVFPPKAVTSPIWIEAGNPWPVDPELARDNADQLEAFFALAVGTRGFDSPADSVEAWQDIVGAAGLYEAMFDDPPAEFGLISPPEGAQIPGSAVMLQWSESVSHDGEPVSYRLVVADDPTFANVLVDVATVDEHHELTGFDEPVSLYWTVEALEPGEPPTLARGAPGRFYLFGGAVDAPAFVGRPLEFLSSRMDAAGPVVSLRLDRPMDVNLRWVDVRGRIVGRENLGRLPEGVRELGLAARDHRGRPLARGVYWVIAESGNHHDVVRVMWLR